MIVTHGYRYAAEPETEYLLNRLAIDLGLKSELPHFCNWGVDLSQRYLLESHRARHHIDSGLVQTLNAFRHVMVALFIVDVCFGVNIDELDELVVVEAGYLVFTLPPVETLCHGPRDG